MKNKTISRKTVLLGISGGVDSSVAALLLKKQGYKVIGAFLKIYSDTKNLLTGECSYLDDLKMAQKIALKLNIPLIILDYEKYYKEHVLKPMFSAYAKGLTPNPDIACNKIIKFPFLRKTAQQYNTDFIATGHYARIRKTAKGYNLLSGKDKNKDQSYFLAELSQADLAHTLFPIGHYTKKQVRKIAKQCGFPNWNKHSTVGICFVGKQNMQKFLKQRIKEKLGKVKDPEGNILGTHRGTMFCTVGQKAGEHAGIHIQKPSHLAQRRFYIAEKKVNTLIVAPEGHPALKKKQVHLTNFRVINPKDKMPKNNLRVRIRHLGKLHSGKLTKKGKKYIFSFNKPVEALAPGQFLVIYKGSNLLASGEIERSIS